MSPILTTERIKPKTRVDSYLKENQLLEKSPPMPIIEYFCNTCAINSNIEKLDQYEFDRRKEPITFIPRQIRRTDKNLRKIGTVFTKNSYLFQAHKTDLQHHVWGMSQPEVKYFTSD